MKLSKIQAEKLSYLLKVVPKDYETLEFSRDIKDNEMLIFKRKSYSVLDFYYWSHLNQNWEKR